MFLIEEYHVLSEYDFINLDSYITQLEQHPELLQKYKNFKASIDSGESVILTFSFEDNFSIRYGANAQKNVYFKIPTKEVSLERVSHDIESNKFIEKLLNGNVFLQNVSHYYSTNLRTTRKLIELLD